VGKTTTAVNLAFCLTALHNKQVLLIDLDPQGHVETSLSALIPDGQRYRPLSSILTEKKPHLPEGVVKTEVEGFFLTPGDKNLIETESLITTKIGKEFLLREALRAVIPQYDVIVIDCPPNLGNLTLNALVASHYCIVPCEMSTLSLEGVSDLFETIDTINERLNRSLRVLGILLTRVDARNLSLNKAIQGQLDKHALPYLFHTQIAINTDLSKAQLAGKPILRFSSTSSGAKNYRELTEEVLQRLTEDKKPEREKGADFPPPPPSRPPFSPNAIA
jgi:chromosome partitioning protein